MGCATALGDSGVIAAPVRTGIAPDEFRPQPKSANALKDMVSPVGIEPTTL